ncbi:ATPase [Siccirubricoccus deserti]|uniref:AAA family ATPase n=1 Tax=Siccirubricoccus deserti TaxID=2013562 RepID=A0A9X0QY47_9PROT|nr:AAA family ATPase [Siccirubricoccus deserti]MBC4016141.1 AAA family ATPase [Siccirubricoccus deserti]GGC45723.1 ATPase [Siccirubricoccus deserti]
MERFFVITGGPGAGKSSLIEALATCGLGFMPEAGRAIIQDQQAIGGNALPWGDRQTFAELMLGWELRSYREAQRRDGTVVFDRGIPDVIGYLRVCGLPVPAHIQRAAEVFRYHRRVFIAPPWPGIYRQDAERRQSAEVARATHDMMLRVYTDLGYDPVPLPLVSIADRARFVLGRIG